MNFDSALVKVMLRLCQVATLLLLVLVPATSSAQAFFSATWEVAEPTEGFRQSSSTGFGFKASYSYFVSPRIALTGTTGYTRWGPRVNIPPFTDYKLVSVPITLGIDMLFSRGVVAPFVGMSVGMDYMRLRGISPADPNGTYLDRSELRFGLSPHVGIGVHAVGPVGILLRGSYKVLYADPVLKFFSLNAGLSVGF